MNTDPTVPPELATKPAGMTQAQCAHLFRAIEHAITYDGLVSPTSVHMQPERGYAILQFAADDVATVQEWAARTGATVVSSTVTYDRSTGGAWHEFGTRPGGAQGQLVGWSVDLWCVVNEPAPAVVEHQLDASWKGDGAGQCGVRCACGTTFDGFDSLGVAVTELHQHIAATATQAGA